MLAQLATMNMKVDQIYTRMDAMEAANAQGREEARAYYEWIRGHYPPPGVAAVPTIRSLLHGLMCWAASIFEKLSN